jgi:hypothetical protein
MADRLQQSSGWQCARTPVVFDAPAPAMTILVPSPVFILFSFKLDNMMLSVVPVFKQTGIHHLSSKKTWQTNN